jgi:hypothetical protein
MPYRGMFDSSTPTQMLRELKANTMKKINPPTKGAYKKPGVKNF